MKLSKLSVGALLLISACTSPDISSEAKNLSTAINAISTEVSAVINPELEAGANSRRDETIGAGEQYFVLDYRTCNPEIFDEWITASTFSACDLRIFGDAERTPTTVEDMEVIRSLLVEYASNLSLLASSNSATEIQDSTANLIAKAQAFAQVAGNETTENAWVFSHAKAVSGLAGFISAQRRTSFIRSTLTDAQAPIRSAVVQLVGYLLDPSAERDPIIAAWTTLKSARDNLRATPTSTIFAAQLEAAHKAYVIARAKSPAVKLVLFVRAHNALVDRVNGPPTLAEAVTLVNELNALIALIEA